MHVPIKLRHAEVGMRLPSSLTAARAHQCEIRFKLPRGYRSA